MLPVNDAVGYVRCSTEMQEDSPEQQKKAISAYASERGYRIIEWYVDFGQSGTTFDPRPAFQDLKKAVDSFPRFSAVIAYDESRWGRAIDAEENTFWRVYFRRKGVEVLLVKTSVDPKNEFAPMLKAFEGVQASQYSKKLSELTLRGAKANGIYSNGGPAPYAYERIALNTRTGTERPLADGDWSIKGQEKVKWRLGANEEVETVRLIFHERVSGKAYVLIAEKLNSLNIPCPRRGRWKAKDQKWSGVTVKAILDNPAYYGARAYNRNTMSKIVARANGRELNWDVTYPHRQNNPNEWILSEDAHPPIVDKEIWMQANRVTKRSAGVKRNQHAIRAPYLLTGLIRCSQCGFNFQGQGVKAKSKNYPRYVDGGWANKRVCKFLALPKEALERFVVDAIRETMQEPEILQRIEHYLDIMIREEPKRRGEEYSQLRAQMRENRQRQRNLLEAIEHRHSAGSLSTLLKRLEQVEKEAEGLDRQITEAEQLKARRTDLRAKATLIEEFIRNFDKIFEAAPMEEKKLIIQRCISEIVMDRERGVARIVVRRLPAITPEIEEILYKKTAPTSQVVGAASSGGPLYSLQKN